MDVDQVLDYALDLKNFHKFSQNNLIVPILVATNYRNSSTDIRMSVYDDRVVNPLVTGESGVSNLISKILEKYPNEPEVNPDWIISPYAPTPTIIEAAKTLYESHSVEDITRHEADKVSTDATINKDFIQKNNDYANRMEKLLPILSGYVSAMFSQYISKKLKIIPTEAFAFDARIIILPKEKMKDYFHSRQAFAMAAFMDRVCSFYQLSVEKRTVAYVKTALKEKGMNWNSFPQYVCSGYVGFENEKWEVETASDFAQKWEKYNTTV